MNKRLYVWAVSAAQEGLVFTEDQLAALELAKAEKKAHGAFESGHPGYCGSQDTFYVGVLKGVGGSHVSALSSAASVASTSSRVL